MTTKARWKLVIVWWQIRQAAIGEADEVRRRQLLAWAADLKAIVMMRE